MVLVGPPYAKLEINIFQLMQAAIVAIAFAARSKFWGGTAQYWTFRREVGQLCKEGGEETSGARGKCGESKYT